jgi:hypothetical protein
MRLYLGKWSFVQILVQCFKEFSLQSFNQIHDFTIILNQEIKLTVAFNVFRVNVEL